MIQGIHGLFYSSKTPELRAFLRDKLKLPFSDVGGGWLIFDLPEGDLGVHPIDHGGESGQHAISFYTDDLEATVDELRRRGVEFDDEIEDRGFGFVIPLTMPGGVQVQIYQPKYVKHSAAAKSAAKNEVHKKGPAKKASKPAPAKKKPAKPAPSKATAKKKPAKPAPAKKKTARR